MRAVCYVMLSITLAGQDGHVPALRVCLYAANCMHEACCEVRVSAMMLACLPEERREERENGLGILETNGGQATRNMNLAWINVRDTASCREERSVRRAMRCFFLRYCSPRLVVTSPWLLLLHPSSWS